MTFAARQTPGSASPWPIRIVPLNARGDVVLGLVVFALTAIGAWHVSPWLDEAATAHIVSYPTWDMIQLWHGNQWWPHGIDLALAPYYMVVHQWVRVVGITPFTLRLPSVLAATVGTVTMAAVGRRFAHRRGQLTYAACYGLLPRTTAMAIEARPYALSSMFVAVALLLILLYKSHPSWLRWIGIVLAMVAAMAMQIYAAFPLAGLVIVGWLVCQRRHRWGVVLAGVVAAGFICPFAWAISKQIGQTEWLGDYKSNSLIDRFLVESWATSRVNEAPYSSDQIPNVIAICTAAIAAALLVTVLIESRGRGTRRFLLALIPVALSVGVMWVLTVTAAPFFASRYLSAAAPFFAMMLAEAVLLSRGRLAKTLIVVLAVGSLVLYGFQQRTYSKSSYDLSLMATVIDERAAAGDGFLIDPVGAIVGSYRNAVAVDPGAFAPLIDLAQPSRPPLIQPWPIDPPLLDLANQNWLPPRIWVASLIGAPDIYGAQLYSLGFHDVYAKSGSGHIITLWER
ncbi:Conserved transmembrane protein [Propionibacterium freudenreichii]|nr:hypothetical protein [Propionibacterium freudenreichii]MCT3015513.1 hypothetical protein [Propionibacterium freudenreichii]SBN58991.1 Conserved transmembrane protein [Propionibacterium freudenreichii]SBW75663.1 Conserved transmembrane protein [Propionibacterium freudenreichii]SCQ47130.1 Conserved transmembrane protein [Propionibacterium freudenreichii]